MAYEKVSPAAHAANNFSRAVKAGINPLTPHMSGMPVRAKWPVLAGLGYVNLTIAQHEHQYSAPVFLSAGEVLMMAGKDDKLPFTTSRDGKRYYSPPDGAPKVYDVGYQRVNARDGSGEFPALRAWQVFNAGELGIKSEGAAPVSVDLAQIIPPAGVKMVEDDDTDFPVYNPRKDVLRYNPADVVMRAFGLVLSTAHEGRANRKTAGEYAMYGQEYLTALIATAWLCAAADRAETFPQWDLTQWGKFVAKEPNTYKVAADGARKAIRLLTGIGTPKPRG